MRQYPTDKVVLNSDCFGRISILTDQSPQRKSKGSKLKVVVQFMRLIERQLISRRKTRDRGRSSGSTAAIYLTADG